MRSRSEITALFENAVGREETFSSDFLDGTVDAPSGGVEKRASGGAWVCFDKTDQCGNLADFIGDLEERFLDIGDKPALEEQVARRKTADGEFRKDDEFGAGPAELLVGCDHFAPRSEERRVGSGSARRGGRER